MTIKTFVGTIIHCNKQGELVINEKAQIDVKNGKIEKVILNPDVKSIDKNNTRFLNNGEFLIPGLIDGHTHAVQFPNIGIGYNKGLLEWLKAYTFPLEKKYSDTEFAEKVFDAVVRRTLRLGTTTACYYASLHEKSALILAKKVAEYGQRGIVGKVNMNTSPADYTEDTDSSLRDTKKFIEDVKNLNSPLVQPAISPRFALSCDLPLMKMLGNLANKHDAYIQTHISETKDEVEAVKSCFRDFSNYASVYDAAGLLTGKTLLGHGVYLSDIELELLSKRKSSIVHCPTSNTFLKSGLCDIRRLQAANVKVALGTDVSGGNTPSILEIMRAALQVSTHLSFTNENYEPLNYKEAFYLATLGGAEAISMDDKIGNFEPGKEFDALVIDLATENSILDNLLDYSVEEKLQKLIYSGDDRNIAEVYVAGKRVV